MKNKDMHQSFGKKVLKVLGKILAGFVLVIALTLMITTIIHKVSLKTEAKRIETYGEALTLFDGKITVVDEGEGPETILLLPGQGTASPYLDFKPLIEELKQTYRVITIEPFGYGLSTQTKRVRSVENYVEEIHEVAQALKLSNYYLMGHSITGLYGVNYAQKYPEEMAGFIGIDSSTPEQPFDGINMTVFDFLKEAGVFRALVKLNPEASLGAEKSNPDFEQLRLLTMKNMSSPNMAEELQELPTSFADSRGLTYPKEMPVLLFVAQNEQNMPGWLALHQEQVESLDNGHLIELEGTHYLHHTQGPKIVAETVNFLSAASSK